MMAHGLTCSPTVARTRVACPGVLTRVGMRGFVLFAQVRIR